MMNENETNSTQPSALQKFERMMRLNENRFFDASDLEEIIEYYMMNRQYKDASHAIKFALDLHPKSNHFQLRYFQILCFKGKFNKAKRIIKHLEAVDPGNPDVYLTKAQYYNLQGNHKRAYSLLMKAIELDPTNSDAWYLAAVECQNLGFYNKAINCLRKAIKLNPQNDVFLVELYSCFELSDKLPHGIKYFNNYIDHFPYSAQAWDFLGALYFKNNEFEKAIEAHDYAIAIDDKLINAMLGKAFAYVALEKYEEALEDFQKVAELKMPDSFTLLCMGECYEQLEQYDNAEIFYRRALEENPMLVDAYSGLAIINHYKGKNKEAISFIKQAINLEPAESAFWFLLGDFYLKSGLLDKGEEAYRKVVELDPENPDIWYHLIQLNIENGNDEKAMNDVYESLNFHYDDSRILLQWSDLLMKCGETALSLYVFEDALEHNTEVVEEYLSTFKYLSANKTIKNIINQFKSPQIN